MELVNEFTVQASVDKVWDTVGDLRKVAMCLPGAVIDEQDGDVYQGRVVIKVGPIGLGLAGTAKVIERDDLNFRMVVGGSARDRNGQGSAEAVITVSAVAVDGATAVHIRTELALGGKIAQFGSGLITQVSGRIVKQFVRKLNELIEAPANTNANANAAPAGAVESRFAAVSRRTAPGWLCGARDIALVATAGAVFGWALGRAIRPPASAAR